MSTMKFQILCGLALLIFASGCQSMRPAKLPGIKWLSSTKQPPAMSDEEISESYPRPSAAAVPVDVGGRAAPEAIAEMPPATTPPTNDVAATGGYPTTQYPKIETNPLDGSAAPNVASPGFGPPPAPTQTAPPPSFAGTQATPPSVSPPSSNPGIAAIPNAQPPANPADVQDGPYAPLADGSATTWDYGPTGDTPQLANNSNPTNGGTFQSQVPGLNAVPPNAAPNALSSLNPASPNPLSPTPNSNVAPIDTVPSGGPAAPVSHYEMATQTPRGSWQPGTTTSYPTQMASNNAVAAIPSHVEPTPPATVPPTATIPAATATAPAGSSSRNSEWR